MVTFLFTFFYIYVYIYKYIYITYTILQTAHISQSLECNTHFNILFHTSLNSHMLLCDKCW